MPTALLEKLEHDAIELDCDEKVIFAQHLYQSVLGVEETEQEKSWYDEAERRLADYKAGRMKGHDGPEALQRLINKYK
jgi:putative addiction module component (TIGR02574 family)